MIVVELDMCVQNGRKGERRETQFLYFLFNFENFIYDCIIYIISPFPLLSLSLLSPSQVYTEII